MPPGSPTQTKSRFKSVKAKLLLLIGTFVLAAIGCEIFIRCFFSDEVDNYRLRLSTTQNSIGGVVTVSDNPDLLFEMKRGLLTEWMGTIVATHPSEPIRVSTIDPTPKDAVVRIALIGDSTAFGWGVAYESTYGEILREKLQNRFNVPIELRNYAFPGYNSEQERIVLESRILQWRPHILLLHYDHNDADLKLGQGSEHLLPEYGDNNIGSALLKFARRRIRMAQIRNEAKTLNKADPTIRQDGFVCGGMQWQKHLTQLQLIGAKAKESGIKPIALVWCHSVTPRPNTASDEHHVKFHIPVEKELERAGFHVVDTFPLFRKLMQQEGWNNLATLQRHANDLHPNPTGHQVLADFLYQDFTNTPPIMATLEAAIGSAQQMRSLPESTESNGARLRRAHQLQLAGKTDAAIDQLQLILKRRPNAIVPRLRKLDLLLRENRGPEAFAEFTTITNLDARLGLTYRIVASRSLALGKLQEATAILRLAIERDTNHYSRLDSQLVLVEFLRMAGRHEEAAEVFKH